jgi:homoserine kinase
MNEVKLKAPATSANLGSGFDICGIALEKPFDLITIKRSEKTAIKNIGRYIALDDANESIFAVVIRKMREDFGFKENFEITIDKNIKHKGGLGGSAAESVGTAFGLNELLKLNLTKKEILYYATFGEEFIDGSRHLDNVAPCTYGGFTISYSNDPIRINRISPPEMLECLLIIPDKEKPSTRYAREVLPEVVQRKNALFNSFCLAKLVCGFIEGDVELIIDSLDDRIVEPARMKAGILVDLPELREVGRRYGYGIAASGAGPALIAFGSVKNEKKNDFAKEIEELFAKKNMKAELTWTRPSEGGVSFA